MSEVVLVTAAELSGFLGVTVARIDQLRREGVLEQAEKGKYDLKETVKAYCERLREQAAGRMGGDTGGDGSRFDPVQEGARLKARQAEMMEIKLAQVRGELMPMSDMLEVMERIISAARSKLMGLAASLPTQIHGLTRDEIVIVQDSIRTVLDEFVEDAGTVEDQAKQMALEE